MATAPPMAPTTYASKESALGAIATGKVGPATGYANVVKVRDGEFMVIPATQANAQLHELPQGATLPAGAEIVGRYGWQNGKLLESTGGTEREIDVAAFADANTGVAT